MAGEEAGEVTLESNDTAADAEIALWDAEATADFQPRAILSFAAWIRAFVTDAAMFRELDTLVIEDAVANDLAEAAPLPDTVGMPELVADALSLVNTK